MPGERAELERMHTRIIAEKGWPKRDRLEVGAEGERMETGRLGGTTRIASRAGREIGMVRESGRSSGQLVGGQHGGRDGDGSTGAKRNTTGKAVSFASLEEQEAEHNRYHGNFEQEQVGRQVEAKGQEQEESDVQFLRQVKSKKGSRGCKTARGTKGQINYGTPERDTGKGRDHVWIY
eukprot:g38025.t1